MAVAALLPVSGARGQASQLPARDLVLDVILNGHSLDLLGDFKDEQGVLSATVAELDQLGFRLLPKENLDAHDLVRLDALVGISYKVSERTQTIFITAMDAALKPTHIEARPAGEASSLPVASGVGAVANYDLDVTKIAGQTSAAALLDLRAFAPLGVVESSVVGTSGGETGITPVVRLDTTVDHADPEGLLRYRAGDVITGGLDWSRPVRLGGAQITTDFSVRPDLITFPVPTIAGTVAVPSTVDVLLNGVQLLSRDVPPGPFEVRQLPVVVGAGEVSVEMRDATGQETTHTLSIYASRTLLAPGLNQYSVELGAVRLGYGLQSDNYRSPAAAATFRRGLSEWLTIEGHVEADGGGSHGDGPSEGGGAMVGGGAAFTIGHLGVVSVDVAGSRFGQRAGGLAAFSVERITPVLSFEGSVTASGRGFADLAAAYGDPVPRLQARASLGISLGSYGSLGVAFIEERRMANATQQSFTDLRDRPSTAVDPFGTASLAPASRASLLSASYSTEIPGLRAHGYATGFHDFAATAGSGLTIGLTFALGSRTSISVGGDAENGQSFGGVQASRSVAEIGDFGGRAEVDQGELSRQYALAEYKSSVGILQAEVDRTGGQTAVRGDVRGAFAYADGGLWASNTIFDSFAVVDTGAAEIGILQENRSIGKTNASGAMLVPNLRSFEANRLGIEPNDVPADATVGATERLVRPRDRSGVVVRFPVTASHGAILHLVDTDGASLPVGSVLRLQAAGAAPVVVGYDGEAYVTGLRSRNQLVITLPRGRRCNASFSYKPEHGIVPDIGPLSCKFAAR